MSYSSKMPYGNPKNRPAEEAKRLSISEDLLIGLFQKGIIPGIKISHRCILFDPVEVDAALKEHFSKKPVEVNP